MNKSALALRLSAAAAFIVGVALSASAFAAEGTAASGPEADRTPTVVYTGNRASLQSGGPADQLRADVRSQGRVRVIVGLRLLTRMEHTLTTEQADAQRRAQRRAENAVLLRVLGSSSAPDVDRFASIPYMSMYVNSAQLELLLTDPLVASIEKDVSMTPELEDSAEIIHADDLWTKGFNGTNQVVAVIDNGFAVKSGTKTAHPMLAGKVVSEACYATNNAASNFQSSCPGGVTATTAKGSSINCATCTHGTHVASIAAGNSSARDGIARDAKLILISVTTLTATGTTFRMNDVIKALNRVYSLRNTFEIASVNMSFGLGLRNANCDAETPALTTALNNLRAAGIAPIKSSGNNGSNDSVTIPGCIGSVIAVGNTTKTDTIRNSSNQSSMVKLMATGTAITAAVPPNKYEAMSGTSMASPHVAGSFALLRNAKGDATVDDILAALTCTGKIVYKRDSGAEVPAKPRIDLIGAYNQLLKPKNVARNWDFSAPEQALDWTQLLGTWKVTGGNFVQTPIASGWIATVVDNCNTSLQIVARMIRTDPATTFHYNAGVFLKTSIDTVNKQLAGYWLAYNKCRTDSSGACTGKPEDPIGQAVLWRMSTLNAGTLLCQKQAAVNANATNTVKAVSNGASHSFFLNGKLVCTISDATFAAGPFGVGSFVPAEAGHAFKLASYDTIARDTAAAATAEAVMNPAAMAPTATPLGMSPVGSSPVPTRTSGLH